MSHPRADRTKSHCRGIGTPFLWLVAKILPVWINPGGTLGNILNTVTLWLLSTKKRFFSVGRSLEMNWALSEEHTQEEKWSFLKVPRQCPVPQEGGEERLWMDSLISGDPFSSASLHQETRQTVHCEHNSVHWGSLETAVSLLLTVCSCTHWWNFHTARILAFMCFLCQLFKKF